MFALEYTKSKGVDLYKNVEYPDTNIQAFLESANTWRKFAEDVNFKEPELLLNWNDSKLSKFERLNNIKVNIRSSVPQSCREFFLRTPDYSIPDNAPEVYLFLIDKNILNVSFRPFYEADWHFLSLLDDCRFNCMSKLGCDYCERNKPRGLFTESRKRGENFRYF